MDIQLTALFYLFLRLAPFVLVSFFTLSSIFNSDFKGIVYLLGLLASIFVVTAMESTYILPKSLFIPPGDRDFTCGFLDISKDTKITNLPIGSGIINYTIGYLFFIIIKYGYAKSNIPTIVFLSVLTLMDMIWQINHNCFNSVGLIIAMVLFLALGVLWSFLIDYLKLVDLQYFNGVSGKESCSRPKKSTFKCNVYKNGKLITTT
jgi:hypothetical protein